MRGTANADATCGMRVQLKICGFEHNTLAGLTPQRLLVWNGHGIDCRYEMSCFNGL